MKFDIEIVCTQQIIIDYMKLENLYNHGVLGGKPLASKKKTDADFNGLYEVRKKMGWGGGKGVPIGPLF